MHLRGLVEKPEGKQPLERSRHRLENNTKVDLTVIGYGVWTALIWLRIRTSGRPL